MRTRDAEASLLVSLEKVVGGVERLQSQVANDAIFLKALADSGDLPEQVERVVRTRIRRMAKQWPKLVTEGD